MMMYLDEYDSPVGKLSLASDGECLCGLWLEDQKYYQEKLEQRLGVENGGNKRFSRAGARKNGDDECVEDSHALGGGRGVGACAVDAMECGDKGSARIEGVAAREQSPGIVAARTWLDVYFEGRDPGALPPVRLRGTAFQEEVWACLAEIPYGQLTTYGAIARRIEEKRGRKTAARAVGVAVGRNPVSIIVPCHRVVGSSGSLTGYAGGLARKVKLLQLEGVDTDALSVPKKGTAL